jgi:DNA-binding transcriptional regulator YbjK
VVPVTSGTEYGAFVVTTARRADILDAAIGLVAGAGLRGLTHRAVDAAASLPEGSTSAYYRTRVALLSGVVARLDERIGADVAALAAEAARHPGDAAHAIEQTMELLDGWLRDPAPLAARLELSLEATRRPELGEIMTAWRGAFEALVGRIITDVGLENASERAALLVACLDGLLLRALTARLAPDDGPGPAPDDGPSPAPDGGGRPGPDGTARSGLPSAIPPDVRARVVEQARTLLSALVASAYGTDLPRMP